MTYKQTLEFLYSSLPMYQRTGAAAYKNSLETTFALDEAHGHPHRKFKSVHIAGTNGKGSVAHMLASVLQTAGYKTGLYTSPHLVDFRERIRVNGKMIGEKEVMNYVKNNRSLIEELEPSFFEMTVDLAFMYFAAREVEIAIIETGMGGRLDSTNIVDPVLSIITNIGMDHMRFLGDSIEKIAREKGGIIKPDTPLVVGEYREDSMKVFRELTEKNHSKLILAEEHVIHEHGLMMPDRRINHRFRSRTAVYDNLVCDLTGNYQVKNLKTVITALEELTRTGMEISAPAIYQGLAEVKMNTGLRGRWEELGYNPLVICDTAHNPDGVGEIVDQIRNTPWKKLHMVWGMVNDKDTDAILKLLPEDAVYYFTKADIPRALDEKRLFRAAMDLGLRGRHYPDVHSAYMAAISDSGRGDLVFIGGSSFVVAEILGKFG